MKFGFFFKLQWLPCVWIENIFTRDISNISQIMGTFNVIWYTETEIRLHFGEILITGCAESCKNDNFQCSQWWNFGKMTFLFQCNGRFSHILRVYFKKNALDCWLQCQWNIMKNMKWNGMLGLGVSFVPSVVESREDTLRQKYVHISVTKWSIVGYGSGALWDLCDGSIRETRNRVTGLSGVRSQEKNWTRVQLTLSIYMYYYIASYRVFFP